MREEPAGRAGPTRDGELERPVAGGNFPGPRWRGEECDGCVAGGERGGVEARRASRNNLSGVEEKLSGKAMESF